MNQKFVYLLCLSLLGSISLYAADSTKITSHNKVIIKTNPSVGVTEYPARVSFPADSVNYRKVYMYLEFGCAPGLRCGEWDYTNHIYVVKDSVRYEIARYITPYGFYWNSSMNWKHGWYYDLTDFAFLLHDSIDIVYQHSGYEGNTDRGWTVTMNYVAVHGDPSRIPVGLQTLHRVNASYGNINNPFSNIVKPKTFTMPKGADAVDFKIIQTGHGMDQQENCAEFCAKKRTVKLDSKTLSNEYVWREDCGMNSLFPQAGTWLYDRANWCPGAPVKSHDLYVPISDTNQHEFALEMEAYSNTTGGSAVYDLSTYALYFKDNRKQLDAALEDIISPSTHYDYLRQNPTCGAPIVRVKNLGKDTLKSVEFEYGKVGNTPQRIWVPCLIAPFASQDLTLEAVYDWGGSNTKFSATLIKLNGQADENMVDNTLTSTITNSAMYPNKIIIVFKTNNAPTENAYTLKDARGKVIRYKNTFAANTIYRDTVYLDNNLCYTFELTDDGPGPSNNPLNKDGLDWWANTADGSGYIQIRNGNTNGILKNFGADFGTKQSIQFYTTYKMDMQTESNKDLQLDILPNPSNSQLGSKICVNQTANHAYQIQVIDALGRIITSFKGQDSFQNFDLNGLSAGVYSIQLTQGSVVLVKKLVVGE